MNRHILLIEDSPESCQAVVESLGDQDCQVATAVNCDEMLENVERWPQEYDAVIIEEAIGGGKGMNLLHAVRTRNRRLPVLMISRDGNWESCARALAEGAINYLSFPLNPIELRRAVHRAIAGYV